MINAAMNRKVILIFKIRGRSPKKLKTGVDGKIWCTGNHNSDEIAIEIRRLA